MKGILLTFVVSLPNYLFLYPIKIIMLYFVIATIFTGVLAIIALIILYIVMTFTHKRNEKKLHEIVEKTNKVAISNFAGDKRSKDNIKHIDKNIGVVSDEISKLYSSSIELNDTILNMEDDFQKYVTYANNVTDEYKKQIQRLPFDEQRKQIDRIEKVIQENDTKIGNVRYDNAGQNITLTKLSNDIQLRNNDFRTINNVYGKIASDYVKKTDLNDFSKASDFVTFKEGTVRAIKELDQSLKTITSKYVTNLEYDIVRSDIENALKLLKRVDERFTFINNNYASNTDLAQILTANGSLSSSLEQLRVDVQALTDLVQSIPATYVNQADAISVLQNSAILNYSMIQFVNATTININGTFSIGTSTPQSRFHLQDNLSLWSARVQNRNVNTYIGHGDGYGMLVHTDNKDPNKYALQVHNGNTVLMQTNNDGNTVFGNTATANTINARDRLCIGSACIDQTALKRIQYLQYL